jgi:hypothetical protein
MISIASELDAHDIAQEIRQERQVHKGSFLLLDGDKDIKRFGKFIDEDACSIQNCFGRENLLGAIDILIDEGFPGVLGLADADFDRIDGRVSGDGIIFSGSHDFDLDVAESDVLRRYLLEVGHSERCELHGGCSKIRAWLYAACKPISILRYAIYSHNLGYKLDEVDFLQFWVDDAVDIDRLIERVSFGSSDAQEKASLRALAAQYVGQSFDLRQLTAGRDFLTMLGLALQGKLGDRGPEQTVASEIELHFRLAFSEDDFVRTPLFLAILDWQSENQPYLILKRSLKVPEHRVLH